jgi:ferritin-like metal-binding protein YciE
MPAKKNLNDLFVDELKDIYNAENQLVKALAQMAKKAQHTELKEAFNSHLKETENQIERLKKVFGEIDEPVKGKTCEAMKGLIDEGKKMITEFDKSPSLDAALISAAQKVEHYEIASYGTLRTFAQQLGLNNAADLLQTTLDEESKTNELLTNLALETANAEAIEDEEEE